MEKKFEIKTRIDKNDYRRFLLWSMLMKRRYILPIFVCYSFLGSLVICFVEENISIVRIIYITIGLLVFALMLLMAKVEFIKKRLIKSDNIGILDTNKCFEFYDDYLIVQNEKVDGFAKIEYKQFFKVFENKNFYLFYVTHNQAEVIRKIDVKDIILFSAFLKDKFGVKYLKR